MGLDRQDPASRWRRGRSLPAQTPNGIDSHSTVTQHRAIVKRLANKNKVAKKATARSAKEGVVSDAPCLFRINLEVGNLDEAAAFYGKLFGLEGRKQSGSRCYFTCDPVTLTPSSPARRRLAVSLAKKYTVSPQGPSACGRGASLPSTPKITGRTRCALSRSGRSIRANVQPWRYFRSWAGRTRPWLRRADESQRTETYRPRSDTRDGQQVHLTPRVSLETGTDLVFVVGANNQQNVRCTVERPA